VVRMSSWAATGGVAALVVVDVALVALAVQQVRGNDIAASDDNDASDGPTPVVTEPSPDRPDRESPDPGPVLLDAAADDTVLRAGRGSCGESESPLIEVSSDSGATFDPVDLREPPVDVLGVSASSASDLFLVGADAACLPVIYRSTDGGENWVSAPGSGGAWHLAAVGVRRVHAPSGSVPVGCDVLALSAFSDSGARVLCTDGLLRGTADGGRSWVGLGGLPGAVDIAYQTPADAWGLAATSECPAAVLQTADGGADWEETACLDTDGEPYAVSVADGVVLAQIGGDLLTSSDGGATFAQP